MAVTSKHSASKKLVLFQRMSLALLGLFLAFLVVEFLFFRLMLGLHGGSSEPGIVAYDDQLGWRLKPGSSGTQRWLDFSVGYNINSHGLRDDRDVPYDKPPNTYRIVASGDSTTEGFGVKLEESYVKRLEALLKADSKGSPVEVVNTGVRGYSTAQEYLLLLQEGLKYHPDLVIMGVDVGPDKLTNSQDSTVQGSTLYHKPYFRVKADDVAVDGIPVAPPNYGTAEDDRLDWVKGFLRRSAVYNWVAVTANRKGPLNSVLRTLHLKKGQPTSASSGPGEDVDTEWRIMKALLKKAKDATQAQGGQFMVAVVRSYSGYDLKVKDICTELGIPFVDVENDPSFVKEKGDQRVRFRYDPHWNPLGHRLAAEVLAERVRTCFLRPTGGPCVST